MRRTTTPGHEVQTSDSVAGASAHFQAGEYDLLLSDIGLPETIIQQLAEGPQS